MGTFHIPDIPKVDMRSPANNAPDCSLLESSSVQDSQIKMLKSDPLADHPDESGHDADGCRCQSWRSKLCDRVDHRNLMMIRVRIIPADYNRYCWWWCLIARGTQERLFPNPSVTPPTSRRFGDFTKPHTTIFPWIECNFISHDMAYGCIMIIFKLVNDHMACMIIMWLISLVRLTLRRRNAKVKEEMTPTHFRIHFPNGSLANDW